MHALGFLHEQSRPDRDNYIDILWDNIVPEYHSQFWKIEDGDWQDLQEYYDLKSVMHYEGWSFLTEEAANAGNSSIVYKGTNERFLSDPPTMSASDVQQLLRRYSDHCQARTDMIYCTEGGDWTQGDQYYFAFQGCDGFDNCNNGNDEGFDYCQDMGCGQQMQVSGAGHLDGVYDMDQGGYNNGRPVYKRNDPPMYLFSWTGNSNWHFSTTIDNGSTYIWAVSGTCPTDKSWLHSGESLIQNQAGR